jgi:hypothetical protein
MVALLPCCMSAFPPSLRELAARLPAFDVQRRLHTGEDSAVYLARQKTLDRLVRIRVLRETEDAGSVLERIRQRARLQHPRVAAVYDCGLLADGAVYLVTEQVEGMPLAELGAGAATVVLQLCEALQLVHEHGLVHGNLDVRSVWWTRGRQIKLAGVGMARTATGERTWLKAPAGGVASDLSDLGHLLHRVLAGGEAHHLSPPLVRVLQGCLENAFPSAFEVRAALAEALQPGRPAAAPIARPVSPSLPVQRKPTLLQRLDRFLWSSLKVGLHLTITLVSLASLLLLYAFKDRIVIEERPLPSSSRPPAAEPPIPASVMGPLPPAPTLSVPTARPLRLPSAQPSPLEQLRARYVQSVQFAAQSARDQGRFDLLPYLQRELERLQSGAEPPDSAEPGLPQGLLELRRNYRAARAELQNAGSGG